MKKTNIDKALIKLSTKTIIHQTEFKVIIQCRNSIITFQV